MTRYQAEQDGIMRPAIKQLVELQDPRTVAARTV